MPTWLDEWSNFVDVIQSMVRLRALVHATEAVAQLLVAVPCFRCQITGLLVLWVILVALAFIQTEQSVKVFHGLSGLTAPYPEEIEETNITKNHCDANPDTCPVHLILTFKRVRLQKAEELSCRCGQYNGLFLVLRTVLLSRQTGGGDIKSIHKRTRRCQ
jgi:hypothetical protein